MKAHLSVLWIALFAFAAIAPASCGGSTGAPPATKAERGDTAPGSDARARAAAAAKDDADRLAALWSYSDVPAGKGHQIAASLKSTNDVDTGGAGPRSVLLVFRDHPAWGRSSYLVLQNGDFNCAPACTVTVTSDDRAPKPMAARHPKTNDAIALFIVDDRALWTLTTAAKTLTIAFPVRAGGTRTARFEVGGLDASKMPGWN